MALRVKGDFHIHTVYSGDSSIRVEELEPILKMHGIQVAAVTDHDTFEGGLKALKTFEEVIVFVGAEISTPVGEILVIFPEDPPHVPRRDNIFELIDIVKEHGGIVIAPHPYDVLRKGVGELVKELKLDGIEVYNPLTLPILNKKAQAVATELGLPMYANSDAHSPDTIGSAYTIVSCECLDRDSVFKALKSGNVEPYIPASSYTNFVKTLAKRVGKKLTLFFSKE